MTEERTGIRMRLLSFLLAVAVAAPVSALAFGVPDTVAPRHYSQRVLESASASFRYFDPTTKELRGPITVKDRVWLEAFAHVLAEAVYVPQDHVWAMSTTPVQFLDQQGNKVLSLDLLGETLRLDSRDYSVGQKTTAALAALLRERQLLRGAP